VADDLYSKELFAAAASLPPYRPLTNASASVRRVSRVCGSTLNLELKITDDTITDITADVKACALSQAASAIVISNSINANKAEIYRVRSEMISMLKDGGGAPMGERWRDLQVLKPAVKFNQRHDSILLIFDALCEAFDVSYET